MSYVSYNSTDIRCSSFKIRAVLIFNFYKLHSSMQFGELNLDTSNARRTTHLTLDCGRQKYFCACFIARVPLYSSESLSQVLRSREIMLVFFDL